MTMPLMVGLVAGALGLIALVIYANRSHSPSQTAQQAAAQPGTDGYMPMMFGDSSSSADCGSATDGGAGCGDGGGGGGD